MFKWLTPNLHDSIMSNMAQYTYFRGCSCTCFLWRYRCLLVVARIVYEAMWHFNFVGLSVGLLCMYVCMYKYLLFFY